MNILVTLDKGYLHALCVMLKSLLISHPDVHFNIYVLNSSLTDEDFETVKLSLPSGRLTLHDIKADDSLLADAPVTDRYPKEMYYRIFAALFLPEDVDRVLYLDPDIVVIRRLDRLYNIELGDCYFAAASHVGRFLTNINAIRLQMEDDAPYINSGVMLMNITLLRQEQDFDAVYEYIKQNRRLLLLPDQDVISAIYGNRIMGINPFIYNMGEKLMLHPVAIRNGITPGWVDENSAIIHYYGKNKPWKDHYIGVLDKYYNDTVNANTPI